jgi:hypothetical protein
MLLNLFFNSADRWNSLYFRAAGETAAAHIFTGFNGANYSK